jgi:hypothetical protein
VCNRKGLWSSYRGTADAKSSAAQDRRMCWIERNDGNAYLWEGSLGEDTSGWSVMEDLGADDELLLT